MDLIDYQNGNNTGLTNEYNPNLRLKGEFGVDSLPVELLISYSKDVCEDGDVVNIYVEVLSLTFSGTERINYIKNKGWLSGLTKDVENFLMGYGAEFIYLEEV